MKKLIAVFVALAMVLSMSVMAFAGWQVDEETEILTPGELAADEQEWDKLINLSEDERSNKKMQMYFAQKDAIADQGIYVDEEGNFLPWEEAWTAYYAMVASSLTSNPSAAITELVNGVSDKHISAGDAITMVGQGLVGGAGGDGESGDLSGIVSDLIGKLPGIGGGEDKEPEVSSEDYAEELMAMIEDGADASAVASKIGDDLASGKIVLKQLPEIAEILSAQIDMGNIEDNETVQEILDYIKNLGGDGEGIGGLIPPVEFPEFTLPWEDENSQIGGFINTVLEFLGGLLDGIFGNGDNGSEDEEPTDPFGGEDPKEDPEIPDTGDVSFIAVAAVAAVAGAALVLTRKKDNDAE